MAYIGLLGKKGMGEWFLSSSERSCSVRLASEAGHGLDYYNFPTRGGYSADVIACFSPVYELANSLVDGSSKMQLARWFLSS